MAIKNKRSDGQWPIKKSLHENLHKGPNEADTPGGAHQADAHTRAHPARHARLISATKYMFISHTQDAEYEHNLHNEHHYGDATKERKFKLYTQAKANSPWYVSASFGDSEPRISQFLIGVASAPNMDHTMVEDTRGPAASLGLGMGPQNQS